MDLAVEEEDEDVRGWRATSWCSGGESSVATLSPALCARDEAAEDWRLRVLWLEEMEAEEIGRAQ